MDTILSQSAAPREVFDALFNGATNFMTPQVVKTSLARRGVAYEVSYGTGINHAPLYGVTVACWNGERWEHQRGAGQCFGSLPDAIAYAKSL